MAMVNNNYHSNKKIAALIWVFSALSFYLIFQFFQRNSSHISPYKAPSLTSDISISNTEQRSRLYNKMARDLDQHGPAFLNHGETSQSLTLSELFDLDGGIVKPILKAANPPVRANVLYLSPEYSIPISNAVKSIFLPSFDNMIWFQNSTMYHFSMFHASHHTSPVPASSDEIVAEAKAVQAVAEGLCPIKIVLDRVVLTSTGVLLGCWQVIYGTDPITIRAKLRTALPHAPEKQLYDAAILHTSFARLLGRPNRAVWDKNRTSELEFFHDLVTRLNHQIHRFQATVSELWYVEELDVLALALDGKMEVRRFQLGCSKT